MSARLGDFMQTASGRVYWPIDPRSEEVDILDIAHALANLCRFGGHTRRFYSVAEHCVLVSQVVPPADALHGLLHDATEAYCVDVPTPVKRHLSGYTDIEHRNWRAICERFKLDPTMPDSVHAADTAVLLAEKDALMPFGVAWGISGSPAAVHVQGLSPLSARAAFMRRWRELAQSTIW